jgi:heme exporter protein B
MQQLLASVRTLWLLLRLEWQLEVRQAAALYGLFFYAAVMVFAAGLALAKPAGTGVWVLLVWLMMLFAAILAAGKGLLSAPPGLHLYRYQLAGPQAQLLARLCYNFLLLLALQSTILLLAAVLLPLEDPTADPLATWPAVPLSALGFAATLTLNAAIASAGSHRNTLMAVISFPVVLPVLLLAVQLATKRMLGLPYSQELWALPATGLLFAGISWVLYPIIYTE